MRFEFSSKFYATHKNSTLQRTHTHHFIFFLKQATSSDCQHKMSYSKSKFDVTLTHRKTDVHLMCIGFQTIY